MCAACRFDFSNYLDSPGTKFIHVHHIKELSTIREGYQVDPILDLIPVCPNCHAMLHSQKPALTVTELKEIIRDRAKGNEESR